MGEKYNLLPLFNTDESKWPLCKVWWNEITKKNAIDKGNTYNVNMLIISM